MLNSRQRSALLEDSRSQKNILVIPLGLLLKNPNHQASGAAFINLAQQPGKLLAGKQLDPAQLQKVMPQILATDAEIRARKCTVKEFREKILAILNLQNVSEDEFDHAWNAMQGDVSGLSRQLEAITQQNQNTTIVLISKTNPIHIKNIYNILQPEEKIDIDDQNTPNPLSLRGTLLYVSYQSPGYQIDNSDAALYGEATRDLDPKHTSVILQCSSTSPYPLVKKRDEDIADGIKQWAKSRGMRVIDRKPQENIADAIARDVREQKEITLNGSGAKLRSGQIRLWSFSPEPDDVLGKDEVTANNVFRP